MHNHIRDRLSAIAFVGAYSASLLPAVSPVSLSLAFRSWTAIFAVALEVWVATFCILAFVFLPVFLRPRRCALTAALRLGVPLRQLVAQLVALGGDVAGVVLVDRAEDGHLIDHFQVEAAVDEGVGLLGVVRQQADLRQAQVL